jgi:hypothetical protein
MIEGSRRGGGEEMERGWRGVGEGLERDGEGLERDGEEIERDGKGMERKMERSRRGECGDGRWRPASLSRYGCTCRGSAGWPGAARAFAPAWPRPGPCQRLRAVGAGVARIVICPRDLSA